LSATIRDVALLAKASPTAVSATLNGSVGTSIRVGTATRERIFKAAAELGYAPSPIAQSLATGRTYVIGLLLPYPEAFVDKNPFCSEAMSGVMQGVVGRGYNMMLYSGTVGMSFDQISMRVSKAVDGAVLVMPPESALAFLKLERMHLPYVSVLRTPSRGTYTVNSDDFRGGILAGEHLYNLGHRRVATFNGAAEVITAPARRKGFHKVFNDAGLQVQDVAAGFDWKHGEAALQRLLNAGGPLPTAIFCANDLCAEGVIRAAKHAGISIPGDLAVVGYDDSWLATTTQPTLTSVRMPISEMGELAAHMAVDLVNDVIPEDPHRVLPVSLSIRQSCGSPVQQTNPDVSQSPN
jgi:LacI family transcriptional regulator